MQNLTKRRIAAPLAGISMVLTLFVLISMMAAVPALGAPAGLTADYDAEVARAWFDLQLDVVTRTWGFSPPVAARAFGYTGVTLYEAVVPGMPDYQSLAGQLNDLAVLPQPEPGKTYHWAAVANSALAQITRLLYPTANAGNKATIETLYQQFAQQFEAEADAETLKRSNGFGQAVADAIFEWSKTDGAHESFRTNYSKTYEPPVGDGLWVRTPRPKGNPQPPMQPYWGDIRSFVPATDDACMPPAPPVYSVVPDSDFHAEAMEVYTAYNNLSPEQLEIARYWADDPFRTSTPGGHSISILTQVLEREAAALGTAAEAYAKVSIALSDAFVGCWQAKYEYNLLRPVTYIQQVIDSDWMPLLVTPQFPEYPSGHSVASSAAAEVLTSLFGDDYVFTDHAHDDWGLQPRSYNSFRDYAREAALSRLYGGIHYRSAIENGLEQGTCVGDRVNALRFMAGA